MIALHFGFGPVEAEFWRWLFVMARIGAAMLAAPFFGSANVPPQVRVVVTGAVAVFVCSWTHVAAPPALLSLAGVVAMVGELTIGLALGFVLQLAFAAPTVAAEIIGGAMGMSLATSIDPTSGAHSPALGQYFAVTLTVVFLAFGGHLQWLALIVRSYETFPPGAAWPGAGHLLEIAGFGSALFATALGIALPITVVLLLVQVLAGVLSRSAPSLNLFSLGLPAGVLAGLAALIASASLVTDQLTDLSAAAIVQVAQVTKR